MCVGGTHSSRSLLLLLLSVVVFVGGSSAKLVREKLGFYGPQEGEEDEEDEHFVIF